MGGHPGAALRAAWDWPELEFVQINDPAGDAATQAKVGQTLGRYKLLEKIGEGGFGVVYVAEQRQPVKRRVALKIVKVGGHRPKH